MIYTSGFKSMSVALAVFQTTFIFLAFGYTGMLTPIALFIYVSSGATTLFALRNALWLLPSRQMKVVKRHLELNSHLLKLCALLSVYCVWSNPQSVVIVVPSFLMFAAVSYACFWLFHTEENKRSQQQ